MWRHKVLCSGALMGTLELATGGDGLADMIDGPTALMAVDAVICARLQLM